VRVLTDPLLRRRVAHLRRQVATVDRSVSARPAAVLISHVHHDHLDVPSLRGLGRDTPLIVPAGAGDWLRRRRFTSVTELAARERLCICVAIDERGTRGWLSSSTSTPPVDFGAPS
jgi:L-ascorbate metabolism protein UlaG (beta-lactamase superfamily)